jgi:nucleoside-diphosphate-sugar epimerase
VRHSVIDPTRAAGELGWRADTTLAAGLADTWNAMRSS